MTFKLDTSGNYYSLTLQGTSGDITVRNNEIRAMVLMQNNVGQINFIDNPLIRNMSRRIPEYYVILGRYNTHLGLHNNVINGFWYQGSHLTDVIRLRGSTVFDWSGNDISGSTRITLDGPSGEVGPNNTFHNMRDQGIWNRGGSWLNVHDNEFYAIGNGTDTGRYADGGLRLTAFNNLTIENNDFHDINGAGVWLYNRGTTTYIKGNTFRNNLNGFKTRYPRGTYNMEDNLFYSNWEHGINIYQQTSNVTWNWLGDNRVFSNHESGVSIYLSTGIMTIQNLTIYSNGNSGRSPSHGGVRIRDSDRVTIRSNTIRNNLGFGVANADATATDDVTITDNLIFSNEFSGIGVGAYAKTSNLGNYYINDSVGPNIIRNNQEGGIGVYAFQGNITIQGNSVFNNSNSNTGLMGGPSGIGLFEIANADVTITGNYVYSNSTVVTGGGIGASLQLVSGSVESIIDDAVQVDLVVEDNEMASMDFAVDNLDAEFSMIGTTNWHGPYGHSLAYKNNYRRHHRNELPLTSTATWRPDIPATGDYELYSWHGPTSSASWSNRAAYTIEYNGDSTIINVNQEHGGGFWNYISTFNFLEGSSHSITIIEDDEGYTFADAVGFLAPGARKPFATQGSWDHTYTTGTSERHGTTHKYIYNGVDFDMVTWAPDIPTTGTYKVFAWWERSSNRARYATYKVFDNGGSTDVVVSQVQGGGVWNYLGEYNFDAGISHKIQLTGNGDTISRYVMADAVAFTNTLNNVRFYTQGPEWYGEVNLTSAYGGHHRWSYAGSGADVATWIPDITTEGDYDVWAWWVESTNRATNAPYTIYSGNEGTVANTTTVNQRTGGNRWNHLGTYHFTVGNVNRIELKDNANGRVSADGIAITTGGPPSTEPSELTITNNYVKGNSGYGIAVNALSLNELEINGNQVYSHSLGALSYSSIGTPATVTISNNTLDNSNTSGGGEANGLQLLGGAFDGMKPTIAFNTIKNFGASGIQARNFSGGILFDNNEISFNNRSGISITISNAVSISNNSIYSNGLSNTIINGQQDASGIRANDSVFSLVNNNNIIGNLFAGIASYSTPGVIGPDNVIAYDGLESAQAGDYDGSLENCVITAGAAGNVRGGILVRDLAQDEMMTIMCTNAIYSNYWDNVAKVGGGNVVSCGNAVASFFATPSDAVVWLEGPTTSNLDCSTHPDFSINNTIDATGKSFGIVILGSTADVTVQNCTVKNAAMSTDYWITTGDNSSVGAGIFISNNATPSISNNYIFSNGWGILDDSVITSANAGIMLRCAEANTSIVNNIIASNRNDGLAISESGVMVGLVNESNTFRNNGRNGIGINDGTTRNIAIAYNFIHSNLRGIGAIDFDENTLNIHHNIVYSNQGNTTSGGGMGFINPSGEALFDANTVRNNSGPAFGGIGITLANTGSTISIVNNVIDNNISSLAGAIGVKDGSGNIYFSGNTITNNTGSTTSNAGAAGIGISYSTVGNLFVIANNYIFSNTYGYIGGLGFQNIYSTNPATVSLVNNNIISNGWGVESGGAMAGGIGNISIANSITWVLDSNNINNNQGYKGGGFGTKHSGGEISFTNNTMNNNMVYDYISSGVTYMGPGLGLSDSTTSLYVFGSYFGGNAAYSAGPGGYAGGAVGVFWGTDYDPGLERISYLNVYSNKILYNGRGALTISSPSGGNGPRFSLTNGVLVSNNLFSDSSVHAVGADGVYSNTTGTFTPFVISNNTFRNSRGPAGMGGPAAITYNQVVTFNNIIRGNLIEDTIQTGDSSGKGFNNNGGRGHLSIYNNTITNLKANGLQFRPSNGAAGIFSGDNRIYSNYIFNNGWGNEITNGKYYANGIAISGNATNGSLSIYNNKLYSNMHRGIGLEYTDYAVISSNDISANALGGIGISVTNAVTINSNTIRDHARSGISFTVANGLTVQNNLIISNGLDNYYSNGFYDASGIRAKDSAFGLISGNSIRNNRFAGIAAYSTGGTIGPNNVIMYDGDSGLPSPGEGGKATDCVSASGGGGNVRGGILIKDLDVSEEMSVMCTNTITSNYYKDIAYTGGYGTITSCGNVVSNGSFFADSQDAIFYFDQDTAPDNLDCISPAPEFMAIYSIQGATIDAGGKPFGIIVVGDSSDVTISNCTIKNAAMADQYRATVGNKYIGAGIFIANNATPSISNNYIFSNGWALLDDRIYTESGSSGIQMRCAEANTSIVNNTFAFNRSNGLVGYETGGLIGVVSEGNTFRNNSGSGIGIYDGLTGRNLEIAYNSMFSNRRGIAMSDYDGDMFTVKNNNIFDHKRSGMSFTASNEIVIQNNTIVSNGMDDIYSNAQHDASGIRAMDSIFKIVEGNTIRNNKFSGIASYGSTGTIGNGNVIMYDGISSSDPVGGGGIGDCVITGGGDVRGGILVRDLEVNEEMTILCTNTIQSNFNNDLAKVGPGVMRSCGNVIENFFATADDAVYYYSGSDSVVHDCGGSTINAAVDKGSPVPFGIVIVGSYTDVTVRNCTIKNAAMNESARATVDNSGVVNYMGSGIFVANGAPAYIYSNYIYSNGWGVFEDRIYTDSGSSGIMLRCGASDTTIVGNVIVSNLNDGLSGNETGGLIGAAGLGNTFRNNGRGGIGLTAGIDRNLVISHNVIHSNLRGIGGINFSGNAIDISHNYIYSNIGNQTNKGGAIGFTLSNISASIYSNTIRNNASSIFLSKGVAGIGITDSTLMNNLVIAGNYIASNTYASSIAGVGGIGFNNLYSDSPVWVSITNNQVLNNGWGEEGNGSMAGGIGNISAANTVNWYVDNNSINDNKGFKAGGFGSNASGGEMTFTNNTVKNNMVYDYLSSGPGGSYMGPGLGLRDSTTSLYVYGSYFSGNETFSGNANYVGGAVGIYWDMTYKTTTNGDIDYLTFTNNMVDYNLRGALSVSGAPQGKNGPRFSLEGGGILISDNVFSNSSVNLLGLEGVYSATTGTMTPLIISQNTFRNATGPGGMGGPVSLMLDVVTNFNSQMSYNYIEDTIGDCSGSGMTCVDCSTGKGIGVHRGYGNLSIYNNSVVNVCGAGIQFIPMNGFSGSYSSVNRIYNNYIYDVGKADLSYSDEIYGHGIGIRGNAVNGDLSIYNNEISSSGLSGIGIRGNDWSFIYSNRVSNNKRGGIGFSSCGNAGDEIMISGNSIFNNNNTATKGAGGIGFKEFSDGTVSITNNFIDNNIGSTGGIGLKIVSGTFHILDNDSITNNTSQAAGSGGIGVTQAANGSWISVINNNILSNSSTQAGGVGYDNSDGAIYITANTLRNNDSTNRGSGGIGLSLVGANGDVTITNNLIDSNLGSNGAIGFADSGGALYIASNSIVNNNGDVVGGIGLTNSNATVTLYNNEIYSNPENGVGFSHYSGNARIYSNNIRHHKTKMTGHSTNSMGIGIDHPESAYFNIENNSLISNATGLGIIGEEFTSTYSADITFKNNRVSGDIATNYFGITAKAVSFNGGGLSVDNNDENNGFEYLEEGVSLGSDVVGKVNIVNGNIFSYVVKAFNSEGGSKDINIANNTIHGSIAIKHSGGPIRIVDNQIDCFNETCAVISQAPFVEFRSAVRIYDQGGNIDISRNTIDSDQSIYGAHDLISMYKLGSMDNTEALTVANNTLYGAVSSGLRIGDLPGTNVPGGHRVYSNVIYSIGAGEHWVYSQNSAVALLNVNDLTLYNNSMYSNLGDAFSLTDTSVYSCIPGSFAGSGGAVTIGLSGNPNSIHNNNLGGINVCGTSPSAPVTIAYNDIYSNRRSGISFTVANNVSVLNNFITSNGLDDYESGGEHDASGIRAMDSFLSLVDGNTIKNHVFSGIAAYNTGGTLENNTLLSNGIYSSGGMPDLGDMNNCVRTPGGSGSMRGGIMAKDLGVNTLEICNNYLVSNFYKEIGHTGTGTITNCGSTMTLGNLFVDSSDAVYYFDNDSGQVNLDCSDYDTWSLTNATIDASGLPFGIIIEGSASNVTVQNCTIKNAATDIGYAATTGNSSIVGAGIFIANSATPSISNNYITSNGWALLDDRIYTQAGASGIQMRCSDPQTSILNNIITSNANAGIIGRECGGMIGLINQGNTFRNNGGNGIGLYESTSRNLEIVYNTFTGNLRGIGVADYDLASDGLLFTIANNDISANLRSGISFTASNGIIIKDNDIIGNGLSDYLGGGRRDASGIRGRESTFGEVTGNTINYNMFAGVSSYDTDGTVGPDNVIRYNGNTGEVACSELSGPGGGDGGIAVRDLDVSDTLIVSGNVIENSYLHTITRKDCDGTVRLDGSTVGCAGGGYWGVGDAGVFVTATGDIYTNGNLAREAGNLIIDCANDADIPPYLSGNVWGVAIEASAASVTIKNCDIFDNNTTMNTMGPGSTNMGGGIFVGPGVNANIFSNRIFSNGAELAPNGQSGSCGVLLFCAASNTQVWNNIIASNASDGIDARNFLGVIGGSDTSYKNTIRFNNRSGIGISGVSNVTVEHNEVYSNVGLAGIGMVEESQVTVKNNTIRNNTGVGIGLGDGLPAFSGNALIERNLIHHNQGLDFSGGSGEMCNPCGDSKYVGGIGAKDMDGAVVVISDNQFYSQDIYEALSVAFRYDGPGNTSDVTIYSNYMPDNTDQQLALAFSNICTGLPPNSDCPSSDRVVIDKNDASQQFQFLRTGDLSVTNNSLKTGTWTYFFMASGAINVQHQYISKPSTTVGNKAYIYNNTIDLDNKGTKGIMIRSDSSDYIGYADVYSNLIINCKDSIITSATTVRGAGISFGLFGFEYQVSGSVINNTIDSGYDGIVGLYPKNMAIMGNTIKNMLHRGIRLAESDGDFEISDNVIYSIGSGENMDAAIQNFFRPTFNSLVIDNNQIWGIDGRGISLFDVPASKSVSISNNTIGSSNSGVIRGGIRIDNSSGGVYITDNTILNNDRGAIGFRTATSGNIMISGNEIYRNANQTSEVAGASGIGVTNNNAVITIANNNIYSNTGLLVGGIGFAYGSGNGVWVLNNNIYSNIGQNVGGVGTSTSSNATAFYIDGNTIENNASTSSTQGAGGIGFLNNDITITSLTNNVVGNNSGFAGGIGIAKGSGDTLWVLNNWVYSNTGENIGGIGTSSTSNSTSVYIDGNTIENNTSTSSTQGAGGVGFLNNDASNSSLTNNTIKNNSGLTGGIGFAKGSGDTLWILSNYVYSNIGENIGGIGTNSCSNSASLYVDGNTIENNTSNSATQGAGGIGFGENGLSTLSLTNNTIQNNYSGHVGGIGMGTSTLSNDTGVIESNYIFSNTPNGIQIKYTSSAGYSPKFLNNTLKNNASGEFDIFEYSNTTNDQIISGNWIWATTGTTAINRAAGSGGGDIYLGNNMIYTASVGFFNNSSAAFSVSNNTVTNSSDSFNPNWSVADPKMVDLGSNDPDN